MKTISIEEYRALDQPKRHKYGAVAVEVNGHRFPSKKQAKRYRELVILELQGLIRDLRCEVQFEFFKGHFCFARWRVDFTYDEREQGKWIATAEDPTGKLTAEKKRKIALFQRNCPSWRLKIT